jgi:hypothetical protein
LVHFAYSRILPFLVLKRFCPFVSKKTAAM